jgi:toxin ParE1/3/4
MADIRWTDQAAEDLESIANFIARDSESYAKMFVSKIMNSLEQVKAFPMSGRIVPEFKKENVREVILGSYRIIYRVKDDIAELLTIHHSAQLLSVSIIDTKP